MPFAISGAVFLISISKGLIQKKDGAQLITGGSSPEDKELKNGFFIQPTIFDQVKPEMRIGKEEIFGPVMSVFKWDDYEKMLSIANEIEYGLTAMIVTDDLKMAMDTVDLKQVMYEKIQLDAILEHHMEAGKQVALDTKNALKNL